MAFFVCFVLLTASTFVFLWRSLFELLVFSACFVPSPVRTSYCRFYFFGLLLVFGLFGSFARKCFLFLSLLFFNCFVRLPVDTVSLFNFLMRFCVGSIFLVCDSCKWTYANSNGVFRHFRSVDCKSLVFFYHICFIELRLLFSLFRSVARKHFVFPLICVFPVFWPVSFCSPQALLFFTAFVFWLVLSYFL